MACSSSSCGCGGSCGSSAPCTTLSAQRLQKDAHSRSGLASLKSCPTYFRDQLAGLGTTRLDTGTDPIDYPDPLPPESDDGDSVYDADFSGCGDGRGPLGAAFFDFSQGVIASGEEGTRVRALEVFLDDEGYYEGDITGRYDTATEVAVRWFQDVQGLPDHGVWDAPTARAACAVLAERIAYELPAEGGSGAGVVQAGFSSSLLKAVAIGGFGLYGLSLIAKALRD